tara:strand:+ start:604 stop:933 length:330 start_codon:yes stop_codon:yes gene_type:complete
MEDYHMTNKEMNKHISDYIEENYPDYMDKILLADGFEDAFVGVVESFGSEPKACYDYQKCVDSLIAGFSDDHHTMTYDEAVEYLEFNVTQAYVGEHTPAFVNSMSWEAA